VTGCYFYPSSIFEVIPKLHATVTTEPTITDLNNHLIVRNQIEYGIATGWWWDAGESIDRYNQVCRIVKEIGANNEL
jgi:dTDP-glucose pyrophosphorylase